MANPILNEHAGPQSSKRSSHKKAQRAQKRKAAVRPSVLAVRASARFSFLCLLCFFVAMNFDAAVDYLLSLGHETLAIKLGLKNTELLLESLGNPQRAFPSVQIAGTNGKGSTAAMLDASCRAADIKCGLYTSPHLVSITERIRISGTEITQTE